MPKLPTCSGEEMVKILEKKGYTAVRTRGSHVRMYPPDFLPSVRKVTVPIHKELKRGTLMSIMRDANLVVDDLK